MLQKGLHCVGPKIHDFVLRGLLGRERQQVALLHDTGDDHVGVDHGFGQQQGALASLGGCAEFLADIGHRLLYSRLRFGARRASLDRRRRANRAARGHNQCLCGQSDQSAGRDCTLVDECDSAHLRAQQRVANLHRSIDATAEGIDLKDHRGRAGLGRLFENSLDEGRKPEVNDTLDRHDHHHGPRRRRLCRGVVRNQTESAKRQGDEPNQAATAHIATSVMGIDWRRAG